MGGEFLCVSVWGRPTTSHPPPRAAQFPAIALAIGSPPPLQPHHPDTHFPGPLLLCAALRHPPHLGKAAALLELRTCVCVPQRAHITHCGLPEGGGGTARHSLVVPSSLHELSPGFAGRGPPGFDLVVGTGLAWCGALFA